MPKSIKEWIVWSVGVAFSGIGVTLITSLSSDSSSSQGSSYMILVWIAAGMILVTGIALISSKMIRREFFSIFHPPSSIGTLIESFLDTLEATVYKTSYDTNTALNVIGAVFGNRSKSEAKEMVEALKRRIDNRWGKDPQSDVLPGRALLIIAQLSDKHDIVEGKQYVNELYKKCINEDLANYKTDPHFWHFVKLAHQVLDREVVKQ